VPFLLSLAIGCGPRGISMCSVTGAVMVNGKPTAGVYVQFFRIDEADKPTRADGCKSDSNGAFSVQVHGPGDYAVVSFWPKVAVVEGEEIEGDDQLGYKYRSRESPVMKVTIKEGDNPLPVINLKTP
jgi:hypothetical protein